jgi:hypothetical protein
MGVWEPASNRDMMTKRKNRPPRGAKEPTHASD